MELITRFAKFVLRIILAPVIWPILKHDLSLRRAGKRPDKWHPVDVFAIRLGYSWTFYKTLQWN